MTYLFLFKAQSFDSQYFLTSAFTDTPNKAISAKYDLVSSKSYQVLFLNDLQKNNFALKSVLSSRQILLHRWPKVINLLRTHYLHFGFSLDPQ